MERVRTQARIGELKLIVKVRRRYKSERHSLLLMAASAGKSPSTNMSEGIDGSIIPAASMKAIAAGIGVAALDHDLAESLASEVEYRLRQIAQDALKFASHAHRDKLTCTDIDSALRLRNIESLYGFSCAEQAGFRAVDGYDDLFIVDDNEVKLDEFLRRPLPKAPVDTTFSVHWLAVNGVQPLIPQNPPLIGPETDKTVGEGKGEEEVVVKPPVKHVLSREQKMYFEHVTTGIKSGDALLQKAVLRSLSTDAGLNQLVPYFMKFIAEQVHQNLRNLPLLMAMMRMAKALLSSPHLHIEPYLHQLMPAVITCLVGRSLCMNPSENHWALRDLAASLVSSVCKRFGRFYQNLQPRITKTLAKALLNPSRPLTTHYGAIVGLADLGQNVVALLILPHLQLYLKLLEPELLSAKNPTKRLEAQICLGALLHACGIYARHQQRESGSMLLLGDSAAATADPSPQSLSLPELFELFGESLQPYVLDRTSQLAQAFI